MLRALFILFKASKTDFNYGYCCRSSRSIIYFFSKRLWSSTIPTHKLDMLCACQAWNSLWARRGAGYTPFSCSWSYSRLSRLTVFGSHRLWPRCGHAWASGSRRFGSVAEIPLPFLRSLHQKPGATLTRHYKLTMTRNLIVLKEMTGERRHQKRLTAKLGARVWFRADFTKCTKMNAFQHSM